MLNLLKERLDNMTKFVKHLASNGSLHEGMDIPLAAKMVWTITSPEVFLLLTRDRNYSKKQCTTWREATLTRLLLPLIFTGIARKHKSKFECQNLHELRSRSLTELFYDPNSANCPAYSLKPIRSDFRAYSKRKHYMENMDYMLVCPQGDTYICG